MYHLKGSPVDPNRIFASQTSAWFGQIIQRSDDGGKTWFQPGLAPGEPATTPDGMPKGESNKFAYDVSPETGKPLTTHMWYDGTQHPREFKRVWHLEPAFDNADHVYAGVEEAALFESKDGGKSWSELSDINRHDSRVVLRDSICCASFPPRLPQHWSRPFDSKLTFRGMRLRTRSLGMEKQMKRTLHGQRSIRAHKASR